MASDQVNIELNGLAGHLNGMANGAAPKQLDFTRAMKATSVLLGSEAKKNFSGSHTPDGIPWLPLKHRRSGPRNKGKKGLGAKPLIDTGLLMASMQGGAGGVQDVGPTWCEQGTNVFYAAFHQYGTRTIPAREFVGITDAAMTVISRYVQEDAARQAVK